MVTMRVSCDSTTSAAFRKLLLLVRHAVRRTIMVIGFLVAAIVCLTVLCLSVPKKCWVSARINCYRSDGSFSRRRFGREARAFIDYASLVAIPALFVVLGLFVASSFFFSRVIPMDLVVESANLYDFDSDVWRENLVQVQAEHQLFLRNKGAAIEDVQRTQRVLWASWPTVALGAVLFIAVFYLLLVKCMARSVVYLAVGIRRRKKVYARIDLTRRQSMARNALI